MLWLIYTFWHPIIYTFWHPMLWLPTVITVISPVVWCGSHNTEITIYKWNYTELAIYIYTFWHPMLWLPTVITVISPVVWCGHNIGCQNVYMKWHCVYMKQCVYMIGCQNVYMSSLVPLVPADWCMWCQNAFWMHIRKGCQNAYKKRQHRFMEAHIHEMSPYAHDKTYEWNNTI